VEWQRAHEELIGIARNRAALEHALGKALLRVLRAEVWRALGMGSFVEYVEQTVGLTSRQTEERVRVATELERLPRLSSALARGELHFCAARELSRVASPETEARWLEAAEGRSVSEIERMVAGHQKGDAPDDPKDDRATIHTVVLRLSADTYATFREAQAKLRRDSNGPISEDDAILLMARAVLGGPGEEGRSSYQIHMTRCKTCGKVEQDGRGQALGVDEPVAEMAECDAQRMDDAGKVTQDIPPATRRLVVRRQHGKCAVPSCKNAVFIDVHHVKFRSRGGDHDPENLIAMCSMHHRATHEALLTIEGSWSSGLTFRHADGTVYGVAADSRIVAILTDVRKAPTGLGFIVMGEGRVGLEEAVRLALRLANDRFCRGRVAATALR
jgi:HNH endonuclease